MTEQLYLLTLCLPLATLLLIFGMRYFSAVQQAKARLSQGDADRQIAERAVTAASETATTLSSIQAALETVRTRLSAIEHILKQVE